MPFFKKLHLAQIQAQYNFNDHMFRSKDLSKISSEYGYLSRYWKFLYSSKGLGCTDGLSEGIDSGREELLTTAEQKRDTFEYLESLPKFY